MSLRPPPSAQSRRTALLGHSLSSAGLTLLLSLPLWVLQSELDFGLALALGLLTLALNFNVAEGLLAEGLSVRSVPLLPGKKYARGIPHGERTMVVYPILLRSARELAFVEENLRPSIQGNPDPNVIWAVVSGSDEPMMQLESERLAKLGERIGRERLVYFHRDLSQENWERKRGAYLHLMAWLRSGQSLEGTVPANEDFPSMPSGRVFDRIVGDMESLSGIRNLLIADSDTIWPPGMVKNLVEKIAHPRNRGYVIFQGRVVLHNQRSSILTYLHGLLQDVSRRHVASLWRNCGRVNFIGHGAGWNIDRYLAGLAGKMAEGYLSHDIVESFFLETALLADVETTEAGQETVENLINQWRRWWKGNRVASLRLLGRYRIDERGERVRNRNGIGKLLILEADRPFLMPLFLGAYIPLSGLAVPEPGGMWLVPAAGGFYLALLLLRFYVPLLLKIRDLASARRVLFAIAFSTILAQVLTIEVIKIVLRDSWDAFSDWRAARARPFRWVSQSSLEKRNHWTTVLRSTWYYPVSAGFGLGCYAAFADVLSPFLLVVLAILVLAPLIVWCAGLPPPAWLSVERPEPILAASRYYARAS